jgi:hypothetical protein
VNDGVVPRGADFVRAVRELADAPASILRGSSARSPATARPSFLQEVDALCRRELMSERGWRGRDYLESRGISSASIEDSDLGLFAARDQVESALTRASMPIRRSLPWECWLTPAGRGGWWALGATSEGSRGRFGPGLSPRTLTLATSISVARAGGSFLPMVSRRCSRGHFETRRHLVLVEGVLDLHQLRAHGLLSVAALGGTGARPQLFERLASLSVETVTLSRQRRGRAHGDSAHGRAGCPSEDESGPLRRRWLPAWRSGACRPMPAPPPSSP